MQKFVTHFGKVEEFEDKVNEILELGYFVVPGSVKIEQVSSGGEDKFKSEAILQKSCRVIKVGNDTYPATDEDIEKIKKQVRKQSTDPDLVLVTHHAVKFESFN